MLSGLYKNKQREAEKLDLVLSSVFFDTTSTEGRKHRGATNQRVDREKAAETQTGLREGSSRPSSHQTK